MKKEAAVKFYEVKRDYLTEEIAKMRASLINRMSSLAEDAKKGYDVSGSVGSIATASADIRVKEQELEDVKEAIRIIGNLD